MTGIQLRSYQQEALDHLRARWAAGDRRVPLVLATGLGKGTILARMATDWIRQHPGERVLIMVHTEELVGQLYRSVREDDPTVKVGIVQAGLNQLYGRIIVASVQTLRNEKRRSAIKHVGLIIVDECHHATLKNSYGKVLDHFGAFEGRVKVAGLTATLIRNDHQSLGEVWSDCEFRKGIGFGIRRGYLLDVRGKRVVIPELDLGKVRKSGGDYRDEDLAAELDRSLAPEKVAEAYVEHASGRKAVGFAPNVESAYHFAAAFVEKGISTAVVHGALNKGERRQILKDFRAGKIQVIWNCAVLTEGFDDPTIECVIMARPTKSASLYQQCVGRGLRPNLELAPEDRGYCLVLDVAGASARHDLRSLVDLSEKEILEGLDPDELSLLEMEEETEARAGEEKEEAYAGVTEVVDFDPLQRTGLGAWLRTYGGTLFLPAGKAAYVLIIPGQEDPGLYDVAWLSQRQNVPVVLPDGTASHGKVTEHQGLELDKACLWAEEVMLELGGGEALTFGAAKKRWRKEEPSAAQTAACARMGIELTGEETKGEVGDLMTRAIASRRIDAVMGAIA